MNTEPPPDFLFLLRAFRVRCCVFPVMMGQTLDCCWSVDGDSKSTIFPRKLLVSGHLSLMVSFSLVTHS